MVLSSESPQVERRNSMGSTLSYNRSSESLRSGYVLPHGRDPVVSWYSIFIEKVIMCGCVCHRAGGRAANLTMDEEEFMHELRVYMEEPFDTTNIDHEMLLSSIWRRAYPGSSLPHPIDPLWTRLGFQSSNPRTDIRTGVHSLWAMDYMSRMHEEEFRKIVQEASRPECEYPFAASCVSVAFSIMIFFHLNQRVSVNPSSSGSGNKLAIKQFVRLSLDNRDAVNEIFSHAMMRVHAEWMKQTPGSFDIHYFATALSEGIGALADLFNNRRVKDFGDIAQISTGKPGPLLPPPAE